MEFDSHQQVEKQEFRDMRVSMDALEKNPYVSLRDDTGVKKIGIGGRAGKPWS